MYKNEECDLSFPWELEVCSVKNRFTLVGTGKPPGQMESKDLLLQKFNAIALLRLLRVRIDVVLKEGVDALTKLKN
ncbi:hypothetical protein LXL04_004249 [Taraxacum kok-saghyz]